MGTPNFKSEADESPLGVDRHWNDALCDIEHWLDTHYPTMMFGSFDRLLYSDRSGVDTMDGPGPAAVRALRLAIALGRCEDVRL